jgi:unsaturated chondroitin disaccharide hydrolase
VKAATATAALLACLAAERAHALDEAAASHVLRFSNDQLAATAARLPATASPEFTRADGTWNTVSNADQVGWTQGFFPGSNWYVYDLTGDPQAKARADRWTRALEGQKTNTQTHDLGFKLYLSFGHAYRSTGDPYYKQVLLTAAGSLASRFDSTVGAVICCDWNPDWHRPVVTDTMVDLELLLWGAANGGPRSWRDMALSHALKTLTDMVRDDGSTFHVVDYSTSGAVLFRGTFQGYSDSSTWTRGQAWAIYGYTMVYRYTGDPRMLAAARKVADYYLARLGNDPVPNWDFDAPTAHKDSSAAAAVASALFELSDFVAGQDGQRYLEAATRMLDALASPAYLAEGSSSQAILLHGTANVPEGHGIDAGLSYGDHYFLEALARRRPVSVPDAGVPDAGVADAGPPDAGPPDAGPPDAGPPDAGPPDAGPPDAGTPDAHAGAAPPDAGAPDTGQSDAGMPDAGASAGTPDAAGTAPPKTVAPGPPSAPAGGCATGGDAAAIGCIVLLAHRLRRLRIRR